MLPLDGIGFDDYINHRQLSRSLKNYYRRNITHDPSPLSLGRGGQSSTFGYCHNSWFSYKKIVVNSIVCSCRLIPEQLRVRD